MTTPGWACATATCSIRLSHGRAVDRERRAADPGAAPGWPDGRIDHACPAGGFVQRRRIEVGEPVDAGRPFLAIPGFIRTSTLSPPPGFLAHGLLPRFLDVSLARDVIEERKRRLGDLLGPLARNHDDAIAVGNDDVAGTHEHTANRHRPVDRLELVPPRAESARVAPEPDRHLVIDDFVGVSEPAARDQAHHPELLPAQDVRRPDAPALAVFHRIDHQDRSGMQHLHERFGR